VPAEVDYNYRLVRE